MIIWTVDGIVLRVRPEKICQLSLRDLFQCGTWYPIWLNGTLPTNIGEEIVGQVCLQSFINNCSKTWNIDIKYCPGNYLVYNLVTSIASKSGYCFGTEAVRATIETTSTAISTHTDNPINSIVDPCTQYSLIKYQERRTATRTLNFGIDIAISDDYLDTGWYRVERSTCEKMPTSAPGSFHCGTWYPIWLNGQFPTNRGQQVRQTVCTSDKCAEREEDDDSQLKNDDLEKIEKSRTTSSSIMALVVILSVVVVILCILLVVYCRKSRLPRKNCNGIAFAVKQNIDGNSQTTLYKRETASVDFQSSTYKDSPPPYRSREPSVASIGHFVAERKQTPAEIFTVKDSQKK
ncbi:unnamed protein product [Mytilus edulis]|uniref:UMOD/GP2/OIT3-like D8C domain-containing protein n=1 Tax=Mytilus edulis TaxID=6550 RepID=A0A8S3TIT1_MYTED|nr:unnamed protein product [Mytilus edulis]